MFLFLAAACGSSTPKLAPIVVITGDAAPDAVRVVRVVGFAQQAKLGEIVQLGTASAEADGAQGRSATWYPGRP